MKKLFYFFTPFMAILFSHIPVYAAGVQWPPPAADIPLVAYDSDVWKNVFAPSMKLSMGAFTNTGFKILGVVISVALVGSIFMRLFADKLKFQNALDQRVFNRRVKKADYCRNFNEIVDDKVMEMETSHAAKKRFRSWHPENDLEEKIYQRQLSYQADISFLRDNSALAIEKNAINRELSYQADIAFARNNSALVIEKNVTNRNLSCQSDIAFLREVPKIAIERNKANREISFQGSSEFRFRNPHYTHEQAVWNRRISNNVDTDYKQRFSNEILKNRSVNAELNRSYNKQEMERKKEERERKKKVGGNI